jgi:hypothetical protein
LKRSTERRIPTPKKKYDDGRRNEKIYRKINDYAEYIKLIDDLLLDGKTTGENQSEMMFNYGKLNRQRMNRLEKTIRLGDSLKEKLRGVKRKMIWLVITEGWCGDAAQNIPVIEKIAAETRTSKRATFCATRIWN